MSEAPNSRSPSPTHSPASSATARSSLEQPSSFRRETSNPSLPQTGSTSHVGTEVVEDEVLEQDVEIARSPEPTEKEHLKVHWKKRRKRGITLIKGMKNSESADVETEKSTGPKMPHEEVDSEGEPADVTPRVRKAASRLVRAHTGRFARKDPPEEVILSDEDDEDDRRRSHRNEPKRDGYDSTGSEGSDSTNTSAGNSTDTSRQQKRPRRRRGSSDHYEDDSDAWSSACDTEGEPRRNIDGRGGVLSSLLRLYRTGGKEVDEEEKIGARGTLQALLERRRSEQGSEGRRRRRWSANALFSVDSASSRRSRRSSERDDDSHTDGASDDNPTRVHRNRKHQTLPHRSQNYDDPYIPSPHFSHPLEPSLDVNILQRIRGLASRMVSSPAVPDAPTKASITPSTSTSGNNRSIVALIISTSGLAAIASPELAHLAPATGADAETSDGKRKISRYEGVSEVRAREEDEDAADEAEGDIENRHRASVGEGADFTEKQRSRIGNIEKELEEGTLNLGESRRREKKAKRRGKRTQREMAITHNIASIIQRKKFIEMLAKAVVNFGAPSHSVESWLEATADILQIDASFIYFPSVLIVAFRDTDVHSTDVLFIRPKGGLELYRLSLVHDVYRRVIHDEISASQGCRVLRKIQHRFVSYSRLTLILAATVASATAARVAFSGSFIDILMSAVLGAMLATVQFTIAENHRLVSNIFEIGMAGIMSFIARGLGSTHYFCYQSLASSAIVLILPGWHICLGALELGSKNIVAGAIRVVWAIVYTLFLSFGLTIGSQIWDAFGPDQLMASDITSTGDAISSISITGSFVSNNTVWDNAFNNGTFTFTNGTSAESTATTVACYRDPAWSMWWYTEPNDWWLFLLVPLFAYSLAIWFRADWRSRDILVMVVVASAGYAVNFFVEKKLDQSNVSAAAAAFAIGILGNLYSRWGGGSAFPSMVVGILLEVPNAIAAAGGLGSSSSDSSDSMTGDTATSSSQINTAVVVSIRMIQVGIGLAIGLFAAALVIYPFGKKRRYIFSF